MAATEGDASEARPAESESSNGRTETEGEPETEPETTQRPTVRLRWRVFLLDVLLGLSWLAVGVAARPLAGIRHLWWLVPLAAGVFAAGLYADERKLTAGLAANQRRALIGAVLAVIALVAATALVDGGPDALASATLLGLGVGLLAYRFVFGVLLPIPRGRLRRAGDHSL